MIINKIKNTKDQKVKLCKKVLSISIACLSVITSSVLVNNTVYASNSKTVQAVNSESNAFTSKIKNEALKYLNVPYKSGGISPNGFDCSGFTKYVFGNLGINLPRRASEQANMNKTVINRNNIQTGDLLFFENTPGKVGHVAIALDNKTYIHASTSKKKIIITNMSNTYFVNNFVKAIRVQ
ncbi:cell wall-associated hydrolase [Gottschalkia purinilytica]|uniref:Cell wall-associated hydrolase n=1 Tax=Gottschalkia purinilytica TaxID=1503 RepID=A0A0L0WBT4_GOTPU|nr:C40 family peptidase [Gottschalkia purinilytica]KNF08907.1 cell wall-associated hydrolase [Gottschalkia purinilytica]